MERSDWNSGAGQPVAGSSPVPSAATEGASEYGVILGICTTLPCPDKRVVPVLSRSLASKALHQTTGVLVATSEAMLMAMTDSTLADENESGFMVSSFVK